MRVVWRLDAPVGVEAVRSGLPERYRGAYNTIQTVLNRLAERGLLRRERVANTIRYSAVLSEADYLTGELTRSLEGASREARQAALASLVGGLRGNELREIRALAREVDRKRDR